MEYKQYKNSKLCKGAGAYYMPCDYIDNCKICLNYSFDTRQGNNNELYAIFDMPPLLCKRSFPNLKKYTIECFREMWEKEEKDERFLDFEATLKHFQELGLVENEQTV